jgi:hypothetical protein
MRQLTDTEISKGLDEYARTGTVALIHVERSYGEELGKIVAKQQFLSDCKDVLARPTHPVRKFEFDDAGQGQLKYFIGILFTEEEYAELKRQAGEAKCTS